MRAISVHRAGHWPPGAQESDAVALDFDHRHRRRILLTTLAGQEILLDLGETVRLGDGDGLVLDSGGIVRVIAAPEAVLDIHAQPAVLLRIAWHLGNRHLPVQLLEGALRIRADHVIAAMVAGLGGHVHARMAPFDPEPGAYPGGHGSHEHGHHSGHHHDH
ncbi:MAG: urease accessory protein UreE [Acidibrevibacterium sp.]|uniref:urease accessory protein UreE n=1 Tax=Acidibrevibacterium sp. TaxID=2606776 RepID=UPI003D07F7AF